MDWLIILLNEPFKFTDRLLIINQKSRETSRSEINNYSLAAVCGRRVGLSCYSVIRFLTLIEISPVSLSPLRSVVCFAVHLQ